MSERGSSLFSMGVLGGAMVSILAPAVWGQVLAYESFMPLDGSEYGPLIGTATESHGWAGGWQISDPAAADKFALSTRPNWGTSPDQISLVSNYRVMSGRQTDATVGRRLDLSSPTFDAFRRDGGNTFGRANTSVWMGVTLGSADIWTDTGTGTMNGKSELVLHDASDVTSVGGGGLKLSLGSNVGVKVSLGNSFGEYAGGSSWPLFMAVNFEYGVSSTHIKVYNSPSPSGSFRLQEPSYEFVVTQGDPRAPSGIVSWNAISWAPAVDGVVDPENGRSVEGIVGDLRIGATYADVAPSTYPASLPIWTGQSGGQWTDPVNWSTGTAPTERLDVALLPEATTSKVIVVNTDIATKGVRFDSVAPYRIEGAGRFVVTSASMVSGADFGGGRVFDVWKGRHEIAIPISGNDTETAVRVLADTFLSIKSIDGGVVRVVGEGEVEVQEGTRVQRLSIFEKTKVTLRSVNADVPALATDGIASSVLVDADTVLRLVHPGSSERIVDVANVGSLYVNGVVRIDNPPEGSRPVLVRVRETLSVAAYTDMVGKIDLASNMLGGIYNETAGETLRILLEMGMDGGTWGGPGISSSAAGGARALALVTFDQAPAVGDLNVQFLIALTYYGDTDLNGVVDAEDRARLDAALAAGGTELTGWFNGDFNYDGVVNAQDEALFNLGFMSQGAVLGLGAVVPEPSMWMCGGVLLAALGSTRRRR